MSTTDVDTQRRIVHRLRRAAGQLNGLITAVETGAPCRDVVTQLAAVSKALDRAGFAIVATAMRDCVTEPVVAGERDGGGATRPAADREELTVEDLEKLFLMLA